MRWYKDIEEAEKLEPCKLTRPAPIYEVDSPEQEPAPFQNQHTKRLKTGEIEHVSKPVRKD